jgi:hypothetical protein
MAEKGIPYAPVTLSLRDRATRSRQVLPHYLAVYKVDMRLVLVEQQRHSQERGYPLLEQEIGKGDCAVPCIGLAAHD